MSVVVAMKSKNGVILGADSQITMGGVSKTSMCNSNYKIWHPNEYANIVIGSVGSVRELNIIKSTKDLIEEVRYIKKDIDFDYIVNDLVSKMRKTVIDKKAVEDDKKAFRFNNNYIIAIDDKLYQIQNDCSVIEIDSYTAIGSGSNEALACLHNNNGDVQESVVNAVKSAIKNDIYVGGPVIVTNTNELKVSVVKN